MSGKFISSYPLSEIKPKISNFDELKIQNLENRMLGPNSEGKLPSEYKKLEESDIEKIKKKILLRDGLNLQNDIKEKKENDDIYPKNEEKKCFISIGECSSLYLYILWSGCFKDKKPDEKKEKPEDKEKILKEEKTIKQELKEPEEKEIIISEAKEIIKPKEKVRNPRRQRLLLCSQMSLLLNQQ